MQLKPNTLSLIGLCREYCSALEGVEQMEPREFIDTMVRLLPRIYITASDLELPVAIAGEEEDTGIDPYLEEDYYESLRLKIENLLGPDDVFLEVFEEEMKYSDTPIGASVAEGLCDLFQMFYNFTETIRNAIDDEALTGALRAMRDEFAASWSQTLVNIMRPLNRLAHQDDDGDE